MDMEEWKSQIKRGTLEFCVLLIVAQQDCYGYEIMSKLSRFAIIATKESTTYPLLRRLEKEGFFSSYWQETTEGLPPRKYYSITEKGRLYLSAMDAQWQNLLEAVAYMKGDNHG